ncbi:MAG TPA: DUF4080 domain-containing protein [Verrucomicrobiota bacterium]|nr:DUF4080 domain-containing protein [Verrucomicrobiota bacterium]HNU50227.1 DUF4080 domain-containing protein [Verrucomicrobiota bacterium]
MADILLATVNAKYIHSAFGLRCLWANLGGLQPRCRVFEFELEARPIEIVEALLRERPKIIGLGVYVWNVALLEGVVAILKRVAPGVQVVLGGPEVSHETGGQAIVEAADWVITGEADLAFAGLCGQLLSGRRPAGKVIAVDPPDLSSLVLPYAGYTAADIAHRLVYVEASRGCALDCEFCLSALDGRVRRFPHERFLAAMDDLLERGVRHFKFVDRAFNLHEASARRILEFFLDRLRPGLFLHFEMLPDRFPEGLRGWIERFPRGILQFEVGIQTLNPAVADRIRRRQDVDRAEAVLRWLRAATGVHVHADLIVGLPGEDLASFGRGFDRLLGWGPQEIQVGLLKRLRGAPISRHDREFDMRYSPVPPYEVLSTGVMDFATVQRMSRFARYWDLVGNSGNFLETTRRLWAGGGSPFTAFMALSDWLHGRAGRRHGLSLESLVGWLFEYLTVSCGQPAADVAGGLIRDYQRSGRRDVPGCLRASGVGVGAGGEEGSRTASRLARRQRRHRVGGEDAGATGGGGHPNPRESVVSSGARSDPGG